MDKFTGFMDEKGNFEGQCFAFMSDTFSIIISSLFDTLSVTTFIELSTDIHKGGLTGHTTLTGVLLFHARLLFFSISTVRTHG
jgi:AGZA family xanthine/uracil permease-like MFS transporter